jgi:hypothetical protein
VLIAPSAVVSILSIPGRLVFSNDDVTIGICNETCFDVELALPLLVRVNFDVATRPVGADFGDIFLPIDDDNNEDGVVPVVGVMTTE